jgi:uncharacterized SAM-binding protein YcdF (DUF218 family)
VFIVLSKTIGLLTKPFSWLVVLMLVAVFGRKAWLKRLSLTASLVVLLVFSNPFIVHWALKQWEPAPVAVANMPTYDIGIVLGGFSRHLPESDNIELTDAGDRLWQAVVLFRQGKIKKILISGGSRDGKKPEAESVRNILLAMGIPDSAILAEPTSRNTHENAMNTAKLINAAQPGASCLLVTSALHMPRSLACYRKAGLNPETFPVEHIARYDQVFWAEWLEPKPEVLKNWNRLVNEWAGIVIYKLQGYI